MHVCLASDDSAGFAKLLDQPGIVRDVSIQVAVELYTGGGRRAGEIEAVFQRYRQTPEIAASVAKAAAGCPGNGCGVCCFAHRPCRIAPEIRIAAGVAIGALESRLCQRGRCGRSSRKGLASRANSREGHASIVGALLNSESRIPTFPLAHGRSACAQKDQAPGGGARTPS